MHWLSLSVNVVCQTGRLTNGLFDQGVAETTILHRAFVYVTNTTLFHICLHFASRKKNHLKAYMALSSSCSHVDTSDSNWSEMHFHCLSILSQPFHPLHRIIMVYSQSQNPHTKCRTFSSN